MIFLPWYRELTIILMESYYGTLKHQRCVHGQPVFPSEGMSFVRASSGNIPLTPYSLLIWQI